MVLLRYLGNTDLCTHAHTHTHTQNMELSVPGNKESNYKITKYGKETNELCYEYDTVIETKRLFLYW